MSASEQAIHQAIHCYLRVALPPDALEFAVDSAGKASIGVAARLKARGGRSGIPDHWVIWNGKLFALEVKAEGGRVMDSQKEFAARLLEAGGLWAVVRSVADAEEVLREWGIPLRAVTMTAQERDQRVTKKPRGVGGPRKDKPSVAQIRRVEALRAKVPF